MFRLTGFTLVVLIIFGSMVAGVSLTGCGTSNPPSPTTTIETPPPTGLTPPPTDTPTPTVPTPTIDTPTPTIDTPTPTPTIDTPTPTPTINTPTPTPTINTPTPTPTINTPTPTPTINTPTPTPTINTPTPTPTDTPTPTIPTPTPSASTLSCVTPTPISHPVVSDLLAALRMALISGNAVDVARCASYPVTERADQEDYISETFCDYLDVYQYTFSQVDITSYNITNVVINGSTVTYDAHIERIYGGLEEEDDHVTMTVSQVGGQWVYSVIQVEYIAPASIFQLFAPRTSWKKMNFGSLVGSHVNDPKTYVIDPKTKKKKKK